MAKKATIKDVALESGVSIGTVDRVIHKRGRFSAETEARVNAAIKKLNYRPSEIAQALVSVRKNYKIGLNHPQEFEAVEFWSQALEGIAEASKILEDYGIEVIDLSDSSYLFKDQQPRIQELVASKVDAIIATAVTAGGIRESLDVMIPKEIPYATVIDRSWNRNYLFHISTNDDATGTLIAEMVRLYCGADADIVLIAPTLDNEGTQMRINGFVNKISTDAPGIKVLQIIPASPPTPEAYDDYIAGVTHQVLNRFPKLSAIYVTDGHSYGAAKAIKESGRAVKLFTHEYFPRSQEFFDSGILCATVCQNPREMWKRALLTMADYLIKGIEPPKDIVTDGYLLIKETVPLCKNIFNFSGHTP